MLYMWIQQHMVRPHKRPGPHRVRNSQGPQCCTMQYKHGAQELNTEHMRKHICLCKGGQPTLRIGAHHCTRVILSPQLSEPLQSQICQSQFPDLACNADMQSWVSSCTVMLTLKWMEWHERLAITISLDAWTPHRWTKQARAFHRCCWWRWIALGRASESCQQLCNACILNHFLIHDVNICRSWWHLTQMMHRSSIEYSPTAHCTCVY